MLTGVDIVLPLAIHRQECVQVVLGDSDSAPEAMHNEATVIDPPPDCAWADCEPGRYFGD